MRDNAATSRPPTLSQALKVLGDRWSLLIVHDIMFGKIHSFKELLETAEGIATNTLSNRLQKMLDYGLLTVERNRADRRNDSGGANGQRELHFLFSGGRRSAHFRMASSVGQRGWPHGVRQYSTFGGTWGYAVRTTIPSAAKLRSCCPSIF